MRDAYIDFSETAASLVAPVSPEIMTGALKDNQRAKVVGSKTFGKGVVQTVTPLYDGSGVAVTIAKYQVSAAG